MQMQKDKIPADISQIPQEILKSYDRFRFCRYLFFWDTFDLLDLYRRVSYVCT